MLCVYSGERQMKNAIIVDQVIAGTVVLYPGDFKVLIIAVC